MAAKRLKAIWERKKAELHLTQDKAADILGFGTQGAVSHYLNAKTPLNTDTVIKFASLLGVAPEEIRPDMADLFAIVRRNQPNQPPVTENVVLAPREKALLDMFGSLPEIEKEQLISALHEKQQYYDKLLEELAAARGKKIS
ncbi:helix-turn-helix domain-containing protein [Serratia marcescens]|nr:helix-turn-helix domain-containing protein [Serratia marcescens]